MTTNTPTGPGIGERWPTIEQVCAGIERVMAHGEAVTQLQAALEIVRRVPAMETELANLHDAVTVRQLNSRMNNLDRDRLQLEVERLREKLDTEARLSGLGYGLSTWAASIHWDDKTPNTREWLIQLRDWIERYQYQYELVTGRPLTGMRTHAADALRESEG